ncbi:hypothetical protein LRR81_01885 [Metabacillus sp. GX 13764]|uniref:hypothetical protein n=1 Tax=Metabacillus kandeliae TaxID=2900151 RepID=UPI001E63183F|nr:hypothetical protein [Metabacillus kandeliae]MCD7032962.1 hypothetical protein [Metabacillus kandeliae]
MNGEERLVIGAKGFVLVVDPATEECSQLNLPSKTDYPYVTFSSSTGMFYTGCGSFFIELDPFQIKIITQLSPVQEEAAVFSICEAMDGSICFCTYPSLELWHYDPDERRFRFLKKLSSEEKYAGTLAAGEDGWLYAGVGTEAGFVAAYYPQTGEAKEHFDKSKTGKRTGYVRKGTNNRIYGQLSARDLREPSDEEAWFLFSEGEAFPVKKDEVQEPLYWGKGFSACYGQLKGKHKIQSFSLPDKVLETAEKTIELNYVSEGAELSVLAFGPDGKVYGTSMHPLQFYAFDPGKESFHVHGGLEKGEGGNICAYAVSGQWLAGAAYTNGKLYLLDVTAGGIPELKGELKEVHRPRCMAVHPDGKEFYIGGYPGYGERGGSLGIADFTEGRIETIPNSLLFSDESIVSLSMLPGGDLLGGTSVLTPGGAAQTKEHARIFRMKGRPLFSVSAEMVIEGEEEIAGILSADEEGAALTGKSTFIVFSLENLHTLSQIQLEKFGRPARNGLLKWKEFYLCLLEKAAVLVNSKTLALQVIPSPVSITAGSAIYRDNVYFASGSSLCSLKLKGGAHAVFS